MSMAACLMPMSMLTIIPIAMPMAHDYARDYDHNNAHTPWLWPMTMPKDAHNYAYDCARALLMNMPLIMPTTMRMIKLMTYLGIS